MRLLSTNLFATSQSSSALVFPNHADQASYELGTGRISKLGIMRPDGSRQLRLAQVASSSTDPTHNASPLAPSR